MTINLQVLKAIITHVLNSNLGDYDVRFLYVDKKLIHVEIVCFNHLGTDTLIRFESKDGKNFKDNLGNFENFIYSPQASRLFQKGEEKP